MGEVLVRLPPPLYRRLIEYTAVVDIEPAEVIVKAVEHWLRKEADAEARFRRALQRTGLWVPPEERRYATGRPVDRNELERRLEKLVLDPPLSEDIIRDRR